MIFLLKLCILLLENMNVLSALPNRRFGELSLRWLYGCFYLAYSSFLSEEPRDEVLYETWTTCLLSRWLDKLCWHKITETLGCSVGIDINGRSLQPLSYFAHKDRDIWYGKHTWRISRQFKKEWRKTGK